MKLYAKKIRIILSVVFIVVLAVALLHGVDKVSFEITKLQARDKTKDLQIAVLGDSIWALHLDETGIAAMIEEELGVKVYNKAIQGTSAASKIEDEDNSMLDILEVLIPTENAESSQLQELNLAEMDYLVLAYGLNDYFAGTAIESEDPFDEFTYAGAYRIALERLQEAFPELKIIICSQTYNQGYSYGKVAFESYYQDFGGGTALDYVSGLERVAMEYDVIFVNNYEDITINITNGLQYLSDATHLTAYGRKVYAHNICKYLLEDVLKDS